MQQSDAHVAFMRDMAAWEEDMQKKDTQLKNSIRPASQKEAPIRKSTTITINPTQHISDKKALAGLPPKAPTATESTIMPISSPAKPIAKLHPTPAPQSAPASSPAKQAPASTKLSDTLRSQLDQDANDEKEKGNVAFKAGQFREAITRYTNALMITPTTSVLYSNRAMALLKLQDWDAAEKDCTAALLYDSRNVKALARRATARKSQNRYAEALADAEAALEIEPGNKELHDEARSLRTLVKSATATISAPAPASATAKPAATTASEPTVLTPSSKKSPPADQTAATAAPQPQNKPKITAVSPAQSISSQPAAVAKQPIASPAKKSPSAAPARRLIIKPKVPEAAPQTSFEFEKEWHSLRSDPSCVYQYWKLIDPASYGTLFSSGFSPEIFSDVLSILKNFYLPADVKSAVQVIHSLTKVDRIEVLIGFMSEEEKSTIREILAEAKLKNITGTDLDALRAKYL